MRIFHFIAGSVFLSLGVAGCFLTGTVIGSGHEHNETRSVGAFTAIQVSNSIEAQITLAPDQPQSIEVRGDDNLVALVQTSVSAGKLVIHLPPNTGIMPRMPLVVTISAPALSQLSASDSARAIANAVEGDEVALASSDSSELIVQHVTANKSLSIAADDSSTAKIQKITAESDLSLAASDSSSVDAQGIAANGKVTVAVDDSSSMALQGKAQALDADASDSSQIDATSLSAETVVIHATSSSSADVCATVSLDATVANSSAVSYDCDPEKVTQSLDDSSTLTEG